VISADQTIKQSRRTITAIWFACVVIGAFLPDRWKTRFLLHGPLHLPVHFAVFLCSGLLAFGFVRPFARQARRFVALTGLALAIEALQRLIYPIRFEWRDFITDILGASVALLVSKLLY
jgi:VanZ family protein